MMYFIIFLIYLMLLNGITSYRLINNDYYSPIQKTIQLIMIWLLPLIGVLVVAVFLNQEPLESKDFWKKHPKITRWICILFFITVKKEKSITGYDAEGNYMGEHYIDRYYEVDCTGGCDGGGE